MIVEVSHFFDNLAGVTLLILARGVERPLDAAYASLSSCWLQGSPLDAPRTGHRTGGY